MILYDELGQLLGADTDSIELFECSDITDFKEKVSDVSDFFVKKDGYIHKFDHYNWIDFLNYSEEENNKVLIKQKNNKAVEAEVNIKEIYNLMEINGSKTTYMIDFVKQNIISLENSIKQNEKKDEQEVKNKIIEYDVLKDKVGLDYNKMENEYDIDKEFYDELLNDFIFESKNDLDLISVYAANSSYESLLKTTNKLKSICTNLSLNLFLPILNNIEINIRNKNYDNIEQFLNIYKKKLQILIKNLR